MAVSPIPGSDKLKTFVVSADIHLYTSLPIMAASMEDALLNARTMRVRDFITLRGEHNDSRLEISGVAAAFG